jgi:hypothetical protein
MLEHMVEQDEPVFAVLQRKLGEVARMNGALRIRGCYISRMLVPFDALSSPSCQSQSTQQLAGTAPDVEGNSARARRYQFVEETKERLAPQKPSTKQDPPRHSGRERSGAVVVPKNPVTDLVSHPSHPAPMAGVSWTRVGVVAVWVGGMSIVRDHLGILKDRCAFGAQAIAKPPRRSVLAIRAREERVALGWILANRARRNPVGSRAVQENLSYTRSLLVRASGSEGSEFAALTH